MQQAPLFFMLTTGALVFIFGIAWIVHGVVFRRNPRNLGWFWSLVLGVAHLLLGAAVVLIITAVIYTPESALLNRLSFFYHDGAFDIPRFLMVWLPVLTVINVMALFVTSRTTT